MLIPASTWEMYHYSDSTRLKAKGPKGEVDLKPVKAKSKLTTLFVTPETGAKLQDANNPTAMESAPVDIPADAPPEVKSQLAASQPTGNITFLLVHAKAPLTSAENSELQEALTKANGRDPMTGALQMRQMFDQIFTVLLTSVLALLALAVIISVIGIANTMTLSVNERRRENAMLRSLGLSRKQLRGMISLEAILITLSAVFISIISGTILGALTAKAIMQKDAEIVWELPYGSLAIVLIVGLVAALGAAAIPAARSARLSPVEGLRS